MIPATPRRAMGLIEEPRYVINNTCNNFHEMPENTIKEQTFCCGSGSGVGTDENMEMRLRGGLAQGECCKICARKTWCKCAFMYLCN